MRTRYLINRRNALFLAAAGLGGAAPTASFAQQEESTLDVVKKRGTLIAGIKTDYPPFGYIDKNGAHAGFEIEMVKYIANDLKVGVDLRPVTSGNRIPMLQSKTIDLIAATMAITRERVQAIDFSVPYIVMGQKFLVRKGGGVKGYPDLAGKTVAVTQGTALPDMIRKQAPQAKILVLQDKPQAVLAVVQGKADAYVDDAAALIEFVDKYPGLALGGDASKPLPEGIGVRPNDSKWRNAVNFALIDMWKDGTWLTLYQRFFKSEPDPTFKIYTWDL